MIAVIDSGVANLASVIAALQRLNVDARITSDPSVIRAASHVILPGVGAAPAAMAQLKAKNLVDVIRGLTQPVMGICLGMQLLFERSDEGGQECLGVIEGEVKRLQASSELPVPHMGWNRLQVQDTDYNILKGVADDSFVYFVHSFAAPIGKYTLASTTYGGPFTAISNYKNFFGCQFHPERSSEVGSIIIQNFLRL